MKSWWIIIVALFFAGWAHAAKGLQPYLLLDETRGNSGEILTELKGGLEGEGFVVLGNQIWQDLGKIWILIWHALHPV